MKDAKGWWRGVTYSAISSLEHIHLLLGLLILIGWDDALENLLVDVPELVMLVLEQDDGAGGLRVEGGRDVLDDLGDDLGDALVGDGGLLLESVDGAAASEGLEEWSSRHLAIIR
jgi:hypothetical protein